MSDKKFVDGLFVKKHYFENGGEITRCNFNVGKFIKFLQENKKQVETKSGDIIEVVNIDISESKEGNTYAVLNDYKKGN